MFKDVEGPFRSCAIGAIAGAVLFGILTVWALFEQTTFLPVYVVICVIGWALGWTTGLLFSPLNPKEETRSARAAKFVMAFFTGYFTSRLDPLIERVFSDGNTEAIFLGFAFLLACFLTTFIVVTVIRLYVEQPWLQNKKQQESENEILLEGSVQNIKEKASNIIGSLLLFFVPMVFLFHSTNAKAIDEPAWPQECLEIAEGVPANARGLKYNVYFDKELSGWVNLCTWQEGQRITVLQWAHTHFDHWTGDTAMKHCRREHWQAEDATEPRLRHSLTTMSAWSNFEVSFWHSFSGGLCDSSITITRQSSGGYEYTASPLSRSANTGGTFGNPCRAESTIVPQFGSLRSTWTESMLSSPSLNLMNPTRYEVLETEVGDLEIVSHGEISIRRYSVRNADIEYDLFYNKSDGSFIGMAGTEKNLMDVDVNLINLADQETIKSGQIISDNLDEYYIKSCAIPID